MWWWWGCCSSTKLKILRTTTIISALSNTLVVVLGAVLVFLVFPSCNDSDASASERRRRRIALPVTAVSVAAAVKIFAMVRTGIAQRDIARAILLTNQESSCNSNSDACDSVVRIQRKMRYKTWLGWTRFSVIITMLQIVGAIYLLFCVAKLFAYDGSSSQCLSVSNSNLWKRKCLIVFVVMVHFVPMLQCFAGFDVLRWRSFYATQDDVWKTHYQEVFDHGIREVLCCLGRIRYLSSPEEDEIYSVARLLGDLVAYRASGTGHLELLAGLALLQRRNESPKSPEGLVEAPREYIEEAYSLHKFAEAAYTGPLLDFGRHYVLFPCAWLYRQGILTPWNRNRRPILAGDNWWRGHSAAFLKYVHLPPEMLRKGRVSQRKREAAYFIVVLHHLRTVVITIRGTETPEDLITDGLGRECPLSREDLDGLINSSQIHPDVKWRVESSFPHFGHSGITEAVRELYMQVEGTVGGESEANGFLSSLLGPGCECDGYSLRIVGHSLGGAIAAMLGVRLYSKFPSLRVISYGPLPCFDLTIAEACSDFVTSIIHDNEFSSRLSVGSIMRLRAASIMALSQDSETDTALILKLARRFLSLSNYEKARTEEPNPPQLCFSSTEDEINHQVYGGNKKLDQNCSPWHESEVTSSAGEIEDDNFEYPFYAKACTPSRDDDPVSQFLEIVPDSNDKLTGEAPEMFLPGLVIHMIPERRKLDVPLCRGWRILERIHSYKAYLSNRESFKDIVVSPNMFLDHLPWRCHDAMQKVLEAHEDKVIGISNGVNYIL